MTERLADLAVVAKELGLRGVEQEIAQLRERVAQGRFFVACVGQFKRGKSSLVNALVGHDVLPVGVIPVTAVVTVVRFGERVSARVGLHGGVWNDVAPDTLAAWVSESENPDNEKGVTGVEVFVPCELLRSGMCLVDTPGLGSVHAANTEATLKLVPHIDAALVVLGADPPLSGAELDLVQETMAQTNRLVVVMNKCDRVTEEERLHARKFASDVLAKRLGRPTVSILEVSAVERQRVGPTRDWSKLEAELRRFAEDGTRVVSEAAARGARRIAGRLLHELEERRGALVRPREESERRIDALRRATVDAERTLEEMSYLFSAVQDGVRRELEAARERFLRESQPLAASELHRKIVEARSGGRLAARAMEMAQAIAHERIERFRADIEPVAERLYQDAIRRFEATANDFLERVMQSAPDAGLPAFFDIDAAIRARPRFYFTDMLTIAAPKLKTRLASMAGGGLDAIKADATAYMERLLETNSSRVIGDLIDRVLESRRAVQAELRAHLRAAITCAESALEQAISRQAAGRDEVARELERYDGLVKRVVGASA